MPICNSPYDHSLKNLAGKDLEEIIGMCVILESMQIFF
jgi:hypothetical protein